MDRRKSYEAYHTDVQMIINNLLKIQEVFASEIIEGAIDMLITQSWEIKAHRKEGIEDGNS